METRTLALLCFALGSVFAPQSNAALVIDSVRELAFPIYSPPHQRPVAIIRAKLSRKDHLQKGFLKIGLFPIVVVEDLDIEIRKPNEFRNTMARTVGLFTGRKRIKGVEVHGLRIHGKSAAGTYTDLAAEFARHIRENVWRLDQVSLNEEDFGAALLIFAQSGPRLLLPNGTQINLLNHQAATNESQTKVTDQ